MRLSVIYGILICGLLSGCGNQTPTLYEPVTKFDPWGMDGVTSLAWSPDSRYLAAGYQNLLARVWEVGSGKNATTINGFGGAISHVAWHPTRTEIALTANQPADEIQLWDPLTGQHLQTLPNIRYGGEIRWSPDGTQFAVSAQNGLQIYDSATWTVRQVIPDPTNSFVTFAWAANKPWLAVGTSDGHLLVWDVARNTQIYVISAHQRLVYALQWSPNGQLIASASSDSTVKITDVSTTQIQETFQEPSGPSTLDWSPTGDRLVVGLNGGAVDVWDAQSYTLLKRLPFSNRVDAVRWSPDGAYIGVGDRDGNVTLLRGK